jgi:hypothetical protein
MAQSASPSQPHAFIFVEQNGSGPKVTSRGRAATSITQRPRTRSTTASLQLDLRPNNSAASITMADSSTTNTDHNNTSDQAQAQIAPAQLADISPPAGRENPEGSRSRPGSAVKTSPLARQAALVAEEAREIEHLKEQLAAAEARDGSLFDLKRDSADHIGDTIRRFREVVNDDGTTERWQRPELADWELPRADPREKRPAHPEVKAARRRWRELRRAEREAERRYKTDFPTSLTGDGEDALHFARVEEGQTGRLMPFQPMTPAGRSPGGRRIRQIPKGFGLHGGPPLATRSLTAS